MVGKNWTNGAESFKLRLGILLEASTTLHAEFNVTKRLITLYAGARFLSARSLGMQNTIELMAKENKWRLRTIKELRVYTTSENDAQDKKRKKVWSNFIQPKVRKLLPADYKLVKVS